MSRDVNKVTLMGNLGREPEIRTIPGGARVAELSLCTSHKWNDREGNLQEKRIWHRITVWDSMKGLFAFVEKYLGTGDRIYVEGSIDYNSYEDPQGGKPRWVTSIKATEINAAGELSGPEAKGRGGSRQRSSSRQTAGVGGGSGYEDFQAPPMDDDDLPF